MKSKGIIRWVLGALLCCGISLHAQTITLSTSSTPSPCYNEGTLTVSISGGTGPYTASIIAGPAGPNLSYPITLPPGGTTFSNLPHGTYTIKVVDATGASATVTGVVGGTYQFPVVTVSPAGTTAIASVVSGTGVGPYQFAISSSGPNSGFGAYQSSGTFSNLCPGTYWIRVLDACGNIYTTSVTIAYTLTYQVQCISFTNGTLTVTASGGNGPYTYSISGQTNTTGVFTGVTLTGRTLTITDACGVREVIPMLPGGATFKILCPFDNNIYLNSFSDAFNISPGNVTYICTNCTPIQTVTNPGSSPVIQQVTLGHTYDIEIVLSSCGGDTIRTVYTPIQSPGHITSDFTGCNSFVAQLYNSNNVLVPNVDSFILETPSHQIIAENNTGIFTHLPDGLYLIVAISRAACVGQTSTYVNVPHLQTSCSLMMKDASCQTQWEFVLDSVSGDNYTMVYAPGDTIAGRRSDDGSQPVIEFYGLAGGQYTLISDSGCDWSLYFDSISAPGAITSSTTTCGGQKYISIQDTSQSGCNLLYAKIYYGDSLIYRGVPIPSIPMVFSVPDSGWYYYKYYVIPDPGDSSAVVYYDSVCPRDSGAIYVGYGTLPYPYSSSLYTCAGGARPQYSIYGGSIPYTVEIPGFDTIVLRTNTATFPTDSPGTYTVIAFDSCGISHSFAFVIIDTCIPVVCATLSARGDTTICSGQRVLLTSAPSSGGGAYSWSPGGGTTEDILVTPSATTSYVVTYQQSRCPAVSDTILVTVTQGPSVQVDDTVLCTGQSATLSATAGPPGGAFSWSPGGASTSSITVAPLSDTMYTISYQIPGCPPAVDTSMVSLRPLPGAAISTQPAICYTPGGMAVALATGGTAPYTYQWSDTHMPPQTHYPDSIPARPTP